MFIKCEPTNGEHCLRNKPQMKFVSLSSNWNVGVDEAFTYQETHRLQKGISSETQHKHCSWLLKILGWWWKVSHTYDECNRQNLLTCTIEDCGVNCQHWLLTLIK